MLNFCFPKHVGGAPSADGLRPPCPVLVLLDQPPPAALGQTLGLRALRAPSPVFVFTSPGPLLVTFAPSPPKATYIFFEDKGGLADPAVPRPSSCPGGCSIKEAEGRGAERGLCITI